MRAYIVARRWYTDKPFDLAYNCAIYSYHTQIQIGTPASAANFLAYVLRQDPNEDYKIYWLSADE